MNKPLPVLVSWSSGKDSAWALHTLRQQPEKYEVRGIFTTVTSTFDRVSLHSTPGWILRMQAERLGLPLYEIPIPYPCPNEAYEEAMRLFLDRIGRLPEGESARHLAFGDLFLEDIRGYREEKLKGTGFTPVFPIWGSDTRELAMRMMGSGLRAVVTAVNTAVLGAEFAGRWFDRQFLADLPSGVDPLGENGEFHTCVVDGPMFSTPIEVRPGKVVQHEIALKADEDDNDLVNPVYAYADVERP